MTRRAYHTPIDLSHSRFQRHSNPNLEFYGNESEGAREKKLDALGGNFIAFKKKRERISFLGSGDETKDVFNEHEVLDCLNLKDFFPSGLGLFPPFCACNRQGWMID